MSKTTMFFKRQGSNVRMYSPVLLKGTLLVAGAALGVMMQTLLQWKVDIAEGRPPGSLDLKILWVAVAYASVLQWIGYIDKTVARHSDEKKERDKKQNETDAFAKAQENEGHLR